MRQFLTLAVAVLLLIVPAAHAADSQEVSGNYSLIFPYAPDYEQKSENQCVFNIRFTFDLVGDLTGPVDVVARINNKGDCLDFGAPANVNAKGSFDGTLGGKQGAFDVSAVFRHDNYVATGQMTIQHATGELAGLHGHIDIDGFVGVGGQYHGEVHFAP